MKKLQLSHVCLLLGLSLGLGVVFPSAGSADKKPAAPATTASPSLLDVVIPKSSFALNTGNDRKLKDPFFPKSTRTVIVPVVIPTNTGPVAPSTEAFKLKGFSGVAGQELVLINNRNLAKGESAEITLDSGRKVNVRVIDIKAGSGSAVIYPDGFPAPFEIFLPR